MSQFPNVNVIPGIDQVGAAFLGNEVSRLQSDTENKRNNATAQRGQDIDAQVQNAHLQQQRAQMQQQAAQFAKDQEFQHTENALMRSHQNALEKLRMDRESIDTRRNALLAAGDVEGVAALDAERARIDSEWDAREKKMLGVGAMKAFMDQAVNGGIDPVTGAQVPSALNRAIDTMKMNGEAETAVKQRIIEAMQEAIQRKLTQQSARGKTLDKVQDLGTENAGNLLLPGIAGLGGVVGQVAGLAGTALKATGTEKGPINRVVGNAARKAVGEFDSVTGMIEEEGIPEFTVGAANELANELTSLIHLTTPTGEKMDDHVVTGMISNLLSAAAAAATETDGGKRSAQLGVVKKMGELLRQGGMDNATLGLIGGAIGKIAASQEASRQEAVVKGEVDRESPENRRLTEKANALKAMGRALEEGTGARSSESSFQFANGTVRYTGNDLPITKLQEFLSEQLNGDLEGNSAWFRSLAPDVQKRLHTAIEPLVKEYVTKLENMAENAGVPFDEFIETSPQGKRVKSVARLYRSLGEEQAANRRERDNLIGKHGRLTAQRHAKVYEDSFLEERRLSDEWKTLSDSLEGYDNNFHRRTR